AQPADLVFHLRSLPQDDLPRRGDAEMQPGRRDPRQIVRTLEHGKGIHDRNRRFDLAGQHVHRIQYAMLRYGLTKRPKTAAERKARVAEILQGLDRMYPDVTCALTHRTPWELLVATILSAQCTDKRVNEVTPGLFAKYPTPQDFAAVRAEVLANDIRSTGFFNNKAKSIIGAANKVVREFGGQVPRTMEQMLTIPG